MYLCSRREFIPGRFRVIYLNRLGTARPDINVVYVACVVYIPRIARYTTTTTTSTTAQIVSCFLRRKKIKT